MILPETFVFDINSLCEFAAHIATRAYEDSGIEVTDDRYPVVGEAVREYIELQLQTIARKADLASFAQKVTADLDALPTVPEHRSEFE